ncbi:MAG TPA: hypothetical protein GX716_00625 [Firmicutes bacterium]|nr:hypothetical protein [Candidatus Fermentithermobacillaceae bacterium]
MPILAVLALIASAIREPVEILAVEITEVGEEFAGKIRDLDWTAVLEKIKDIDGGRFRKVKIRVKDGDTVEEVEVDLDTKLKPGPVKSILDSIKDYVNHQGRRGK